MGLLRRNGDTGTTKYRMREKLFAIGDDFWIDTDDDRHAYKVNGKALRIRKTFVLETPSGDELFRLRERKLAIRDTMELEAGGDTVATIKKAMITPLRDRYAIHLADGGELSAKGNIVDHEYKIERDGDKIAEVSKKWFRMRDTYGIDINAEEDDVLILAAAVCLEEMSKGVVD